MALNEKLRQHLRKTICFSKTTQMHDMVIGLFVNRYAFRRAV
jgi:insertion element IS1 protein InsB